MAVYIWAICIIWGLGILSASMAITDVLASVHLS